MTMFSVKLRCLFIAIVGCIDLSSGCSCRAEYPLRSSYADAKNIFIGQAIQIQKYIDWNRQEIQFKIETKFKGIFSSSNKINVSTTLHEDSCGLPIQVGQKWQVWASFESYYYFPDPQSTHSQEKIFLSTNRCDLTTSELYKNIEFLLNPPRNLTNSG